jgi:hypothetical protein
VTVERFPKFKNFRLKSIPGGFQPKPYEKDIALKLLRGRSVREAAKEMALEYMGRISPRYQHMFDHDREYREQRLLIKETLEKKEFKVWLSSNALELLFYFVGTKWAPLSTLRDQAIQILIYLKHGRFTTVSLKEEKAKMRMLIRLVDMLQPSDKELLFNVDANCEKWIK